MHLRNDFTAIEKLAQEKERLATFTDWPIDFIDKRALAKNGFYYRGYNDHVICIFCGVEIGYWEEGDDPKTEHRKHSPDCKLLAQIYTTDTSTIRSEDECGCVIGGKPERSLYHTFDERFDSFEDWPISMKQPKKAMAQAGFYYTGKGDKVICFSCGLGIHKWKDEDDAWIEHAKWNPKCDFVRQEKGDEFVREVVNNAAKIAEDEKKRLSEIQEYSATEERLLCTVCKCQERNIVSIPCKHLATCKTCNNELKTCPICRTEEINTIEVNIS